MNAGRPAPILRAWKRAVPTALAILLSLIPMVQGREAGVETFREVLFREDFDDLGDWRNQNLPGVKNLCLYSVEEDERLCYLRAESKSSASGIVWKGEFDVYSYPRIRWRWKVSRVYDGGNAAVKSGDDYPLRVYVNFKYDREDPAVKRSLKYTLARALHGRYPPYSSLNYIWANRLQDRPILANPYTDRAMMVLKQMGDEKTGQWVVEQANVLEDYRRAFGTDPPRAATLAIMNDSDDTGESSVSYVDFIEIYRLPGD